MLGGWHFGSASESRPLLARTDKSPPLSVSILVATSPDMASYACVRPSLPVSVFTKAARVMPGAWAATVVINNSRLERVEVVGATGGATAGFCGGGDFGALVPACSTLSAFSRASLARHQDPPIAS